LASEARPPGPLAAQLLQTARELRPRIEAAADQIERDRKLPDGLARELMEAGFSRMLVPRDYGGSEITPEEYLAVLEELGRADGSTAWVVALLACNSISAGYLPGQVAREMFAGNPMAGIAGSLAPALRGPDEAPNGAEVSEDGYRLSGRWSFASGCMHASHMIALAPVHRDGQARRHPSGAAEQRWFFFPKERCEIVEDWSTLGMRGTGSHQFVVSDLLIEESWTLPATMPITPVHPGPLYTFSAGPAFAERHIPLAGVSTTTLIGVCLGIARGMIDAFMELAPVSRGMPPLKDNVLVQDKVGRAEAILRAARAYQLTSLRDAWQQVLRHGPGDWGYIKDLALAGAHTALMCAEAVDLIWSAAAINSVFVPGPFERRFRDIHVATQNGGITPAIYSMAGRHLMNGAYEK
jgi:alkylation response protein AidB-like acyl-CoA dehydrogenase